MSVDRLKRDAIDAAQKYKARYKQSLDPNDLDMFKRFMDVYNHLSDIGGGGGSQNLQEVTDVGNTTTNTIETAGTKSDYFLLDTLATPTPQQGMLFWDEDRSTVGLQMNGVEARLGQDNFWYVKNQTGSPIPKGTAVMAVGALGASSRILVAPMIADGSVESKYFLGITAEEILNGEDGFVTNIGKIRGIDTSVYGTQAGQILYCDPANPGGFTITQPTAPNLDIAAAFTVDYKSNGTLAVRALPGYELNELHDVYINTPSTGQLLRYNTNRWENWTPNFLTTVPTLDQVTTAGNTTTNGISIGSLAVDTNLIYTDAVNNRVGVGTTSPTYKLHIDTDDSGLYVVGAKVFPFIQKIARFVYGGNGNSIDIENQSGKASIQARDGNPTMPLQLNAAGGNVLIGTTTDAGYKLDVNGTARVSGNLTVDTNTLFVDAANDRVGIGTLTPNQELELLGTFRSKAKTGSDNVFFEGMNSAGTMVAQMKEGSTVGMGGLFFLGQRNNSSGGDGVYFGGYVGTSAGNNAAVEFRGIGGTIASPALHPTSVPIVKISRIDTPTTAKDEFIVYGDGNVGINTTSNAGYKLDVNGTARVNGYVETEGLGIYGINVLTYVDPIVYVFDGALTFSNLIGFTQIKAGGFFVGVHVDANDGKVGIANETPQFTLDVAGTLGAQLTNATSTSQVYYDTTTGELTYGALPTPATPTLDQVTTAGNTTTNGITVGDLTVNNANQIRFIAQGGLTESVAFSSNSSFNRIAIYNNGSTSNGSLITFGRSSFSTDGQIGSLGGLVGGVDNYGIGMLTNASNPIAFYHGITSRLRIAPNTGNVLINTTTDSGYKLDVNGTSIFRGDLSTSSGKNMLFGTTLPSRHTNSAAYPGIFVGNSNSAIFGETTTGYKGIGMYANVVRDTSLFWVLQDTTQPGWLVGTYYETLHTDYFGIYRAPATSGTIAPVALFTIKGTGNVLIGTTTDAGYKLDINGTGRFSGNLIASARVGVGTTNPEWSKLQVDQGYTGWSVSNINASAYSPDSYVERSIFRVDSANQAMYFGMSSVINDRRGYIQVGHESTAYANGIGSLLLNPVGGNVGIGNTSPVSKLQVTGGSSNWNESTPGVAVGTIHLTPASTDNFGNAITFGASDTGSGNNAQAGIYTRSDSTYGTKMYFATTDSYASGSKTRMFIDYNGNVGIGTTSPITKLQLEGESGATRTSLLALAKSGGYGATALIQNYSSVQYSGGKSFEIDVEGYNLLQLHTNNPGNAGRVILPNGNVLVGLTSDNAIDKLQVKGSGLFNIVGGSTRQLALSIVRDSGFGSTQFFQNYSSSQFTNGKSLEVDVFGLNLLQLHTDYTGATGRVIFPTGNLLVNTTTDSGVDKLQVNGSVGATAINSTGNITTNTDFIVNTTGATLGLSITANNPRILMVDTVGGSDPVSITDNSGSLNITSNWFINLRKQGATHPTISALRNQNVLLSTSTDNGLGKLQVEGNITAFTYYSNGLAGWSGVIPVPGNPPGLQNIEVTGGIITNVF